MTRRGGSSAQPLEQRRSAAVRRSGAGTSRADSSTNGAARRERPAPPAQPPARRPRRHPRRPRRRARRHRRQGDALATITTAPTYTRRPRNRTDGGVARWRHPSRPQQRLKRRRERLGRHGQQSAARLARVVPAMQRAPAVPARLRAPPAPRSPRRSPPAPQKTRSPARTRSNIVHLRSDNSEASPSERL